MNKTMSDCCNPDVAILMGSQSDFDTMKESCRILKDLEISFITRIVSAHRTPDRLYDFAKSAEKNGIKVIIAGAGGAAHLPGMLASLACIPVIGVPIKSKYLNGIDSLLSIVQMPKGIPVATMSIGIEGSHNAALMAASILSLSNSNIAIKIKEHRLKQSLSIKDIPSISSTNH